MKTQNSKGRQIFRGGNSKIAPTRLRVLTPSRRLQNFRPIGAEMAELNSFFEIAVAPHRNAMRARYKDPCQKSTNGVGVLTPLQGTTLRTFENKRKETYIKSNTPHE